jgi:hypothetical protein
MKWKWLHWGGNLVEFGSYGACPGTELPELNSGTELV